MSPQVWGQAADSNGPVSLADYLNLAAINNAELKAEFEKWKAAIEEIPQAKSLEDPQLTVRLRDRTHASAKRIRGDADVPVVRDD